MMWHSLDLLDEEEHFDLFHSFFLFPVGFVAGLIARRSKRPHIATIVGNDVKKYVFSPEKTAMCRSALENASIVVGLSRELVEVSDSLTPIETKSRVIFNSVRIPDARRVRPRLSGEPFRVGCAAIFKYAKGLPYLLKAVAALHEEAPGGGPSVELDLAGEFRSEEKPIFEAMVDRLGIARLVKLSGPLPHDRMPEWFESLDCFVLPSISEGCPNVLMEAMASGLPCIATRTGAVGDLIEHGVSGLITPRGDSASLADALRRLAADPQRAQEWGKRARERMKLFSHEREAGAWAAVYDELLGR
jgi:glycosyltransferase involved in cell wall biosynthesis